MGAARARAPRSGLPQIDTLFASRGYSPYFLFPELGPASHHFGKLLVGPDHVIATGATVSGNYVYTAFRVDL